MQTINVYNVTKENKTLNYGSSCYVNASLPDIMNKVFTTNENIVLEQDTQMIRLSFNGNDKICNNMKFNISNYYIEVINDNEEPLYYRCGYYEVKANTLIVTAKIELWYTYIQKALTGGLGVDAKSNVFFNRKHDNYLIRKKYDMYNSYDLDKSKSFIFDTNINVEPTINQPNQILVNINSLLQIDTTGLIHSGANRGVITPSLDNGWSITTEKINIGGTTDDGYALTRLKLKDIQKHNIIDKLNTGEVYEDYNYGIYSVLFGRCDVDFLHNQVSDFHPFDLKNYLFFKPLLREQNYNNDTENGSLLDDLISITYDKFSPLYCGITALPIILPIVNAGRFDNDLQVAYGNNITTITNENVNSRTGLYSFLYTTTSNKLNVTLDFLSLSMETSKTQYFECKHNNNDYQTSLQLQTDLSVIYQLLYKITNSFNDVKYSYWLSPPLLKSNKFTLSYNYQEETFDMRYWLYMNKFLLSMDLNYPNLIFSIFPINVVLGNEVYYTEKINYNLYKEQRYFDWKKPLLTSSVQNFQTFLDLSSDYNAFVRSNHINMNQQMKLIDKTKEVNKNQLLADDIMTGLSYLSPLKASSTILNLGTNVGDDVKNRVMAHQKNDLNNLSLDTQWCMNYGAGKEQNLNTNTQLKVDGTGNNAIYNGLIYYTEKNLNIYDSAKIINDFINFGCLYNNFDLLKSWKVRKLYNYISIKNISQAFNNSNIPLIYWNEINDLCEKGIIIVEKEYMNNFKLFDILPSLKANRILVDVEDCNDFLEDTYKAF